MTAVTVTQADRDAGADVLYSYGRHSYAKLVREGHHDDGGAVQVSAHHRIAAEQAGYRRGVEDAAMVCGTLAGTECDIWPGFEAALSCEAAIRALLPNKETE